jgi:hypothetical protein
MMVYPFKLDDSYPISGRFAHCCTRRCRRAAIHARKECDAMGARLENVVGEIHDQLRATRSELARLKTLDVVVRPSATRA